MINKKIVLIFGVVFVFLVIFIIWLVNLIFNFPSLNQPDKLFQLFKKNSFEAKGIFREFKKNLNNLQELMYSTTTSRQEILTEEEIEKIKIKIEEYENKKGQINNETNSTTTPNYSSTN